MKRVKDDDKIMGPMFPRLHVNDTGKGGPRAPPRNKMALYEQLSIPSQRYNSGSKPLNHNNSNHSATPSTSTLQGAAHERNMYFPLYRQPSTSSYDEVQVSRPESADLSNQMPLGENQKQPLEDDDFMVPIFSQQETTTCNGKNQPSMHEERRNDLGSSNSAALQRAGGKETGTSNAGDFISKQLLTNPGKRSSRASNASTRYSYDVFMREKDDRPWRKDTCTQSRYQDKYMMSTLENTDAILRQEREDDLSAIDATNGVAVLKRPLDNPLEQTSLRLSDNPRVGCCYVGDDKTDDDLQRLEKYQPPEKGNIDQMDNVSETSMVDTVSGFDITPDDVVRMIGRKHFWKARTAIANHQRVIAVQMFELHRLVKVQKLISESPELLLGSAFVGKSSLKGSTLEKYSSEYAAKALGHKSAPKEGCQKITDKVEGTAENAVTKSPPIPPQNAIQAAPYRPSSVNTNPTFPPVNMDPKMNPWSFHQPGPHQWLMPVMSPSEGLVYKPYPAPPGYMGPMCGGYGPVGPTPVMNPAYGMPNPHYPGIVMPPGMHHGGQGYFPPYGMPMPMISPSVSGSTVEQLNPFSGPNAFGQTGQPAGTSVKFGSMKHQGSLNMPSQNNGTKAPVARSQPLKERELQGSTASSPSQRTQETGTVQLMEGRDTLSLFPAAPTEQISAGFPTETPTRVIKVVPHKPGSTRESAARIFQSIQEERRHFEYN
ncbi:unnamed protein product [Amaranthus hypochondriacus]